jgi:hypothetical protein
VLSCNGSFHSLDTSLWTDTGVVYIFSFPWFAFLF